VGAARTEAEDRGLARMRNGGVAKSSIPHALHWDSLMLERTTLSVALAVVQGIACGQPGSDAKRRGEPSFGDFPVARLYTGPIATAKFKNASDEKRLGAVLRTVRAEPNFAGHWRIMQFRTGDGPLGAVLLDARSGDVFRLPQEIVGLGFYIPNTDCLASIRRWQHPASVEEDDSLPLAFTSASELLIVRRCIVRGAPVVGMERNYYRWHRRKWCLLERVSLGPPPPEPVY